MVNWRAFWRELLIFVVAFFCSISILTSSRLGWWVPVTTIILAAFTALMALYTRDMVNENRLTRKESKDQAHKNAYCEFLVALSYALQDYSIWYMKTRAQREEIYKNIKLIPLQANVDKVFFRRFIRDASLPEILTKRISYLLTCNILRDRKINELIHEKEEAEKNKIEKYQNPQNEAVLNRILKQIPLSIEELVLSNWFGLIQISYLTIHGALKQGFDDMVNNLLNTGRFKPPYVLKSFSSEDIERKVSFYPLGFSKDLLQKLEKEYPQCSWDALKTYTDLT